MKIRSIFLLLTLTAYSQQAPEYNNTSVGNSAEEFPISVDDDADQELSIQLHDVETRANGWTAWSEWSACSRSCDGGVAHQLRRCQTNGCRGDRIRHKICNMQPCPESRDFRDDQCTAYNTIPYEGAIYQWIAHYDDLEPCTLVCRGRQMPASHLQQPPPMPPQVHQMLQDDQQQDAVLVVAKLADKVQDGTRCRPGSLDMCIDGKCQRIGCDLKIGSKKQVDVCGVCGGDSSSCTRTLYHWTLAPMSLCSATCGGGYKMSRPVCENRVSGEEVEEQLCNESQKPESAIVPCNGRSCPPKWHNGEWGPCSVTCGGGSKMRQVSCVEETNNTKIKIPDQKCSGYKPRFQEACNQLECPKWHPSQWSGCSVSCGEGIQVRVVNCRDYQDQESDQCTARTKPTPTKPCSTGILCPYHVTSGLEDNSDEDQLLMPGLYHTQPLVQPYPPPPAHAERLIGEQITPTESTFIPDEWGPCSVSCGDGVRRREVNCKIFLEFSRTIAKLPDKQCSGPKPSETDRCFMEPCSAESAILDAPSMDSNPIKIAPGIAGKNYSWKEQGYTACSATCLGGVQELIINCVRDDNQRVASPYLCPKELKPEMLIRTCNDHPCPPRWNYSDFQPCTQSCGIGIQTREVNCIHEVTQGGGNTVVVPNNMCPQPQPPDRQYCNVLDCPVRWKVSDWSKCSKICGGGEKSRKVECKQVMAQNHTVDRTHNMCPSPRPPEKKPCNTKSCVLDSDKPHIETSNTTFIQHDPKKKKISLKVGGAATVFHGTIIKIKCPVKHYNRTKILWAKDHTYLTKSKKYKTSKKGALRVQNLTYRDSGIYTCVAGGSSAHLTLSVRPRPGEFMNSEEVQKQQLGQKQQSGYKSEKVDVEISDTYREDGNPLFDDHSHEQRPDYINKKKQNKQKLFTPTLPSLRLDSGNGLNAWPTQSTRSSLDHDQDKMVPSNLPASATDTKKPSFGEASSASSASRAMPHFQMLISNLQTFGNSRGHRMVAFPNEDDDTSSMMDHHQLLVQHHQQQLQHKWPLKPAPFFASDMDQLDGVHVEDDDDEDENGSVVVLGKGSPENLRFDWTVTEWSRCSQSCGGNGYQIRSSQCMVSLNNKSQEVESNLCEDAGLDSPKTTRKCGLEDCPKWSVGEWTDCDTSRCFSLRIAMQKREIHCQNQNNITMDNSRCNASEKPMHRQECINERCVGKWKAESWSDCAANCNGIGVKYRILRCVWFGTKKPAGNACRNQARPPVTKPCKGPPCDNESECKDNSMFCPNVRTMNMCRLTRYKQQCCRSCSVSGVITS